MAHAATQMRHAHMPPETVGHKVGEMRLFLQQRLAAWQMNERTAAKPAHVAIVIAGPMAADCLIGADLDQTLPIVDQRIQRRGNKRFVTMMSQALDFGEITRITGPRARHQPA